MSEKAEGKKKGGKLPIIIVLVLVLAGGGFFMMKPKGDAKKEPEIKLGKDILSLDEMIVNLRGGDNYARLKVGLQFTADFDAKHADTIKDVLRDAIITAVSARSISEVRSVEGKEALKIAIAKSVNEKLHVLHEEKEEKKDEKKKKKDKDEESDEHSEEESSEPENPHWHSDKGPVLIVYFSDFVTQ